MPSLAKNQQHAVPVERALFERVTESGRAAVAIADKLPVMLKQRTLSKDDLSRLIVSIEKCRVESGRNVRDAESDTNPRMLSLAQRIEGLWASLKEKASAHVSYSH